MLRLRGVWRIFQNRRHYVWGSMLGLVICWLTVNLFRLRFQTFSMTDWRLFAFHWPLLFLGSIGVLIWVTATWQRFYRVSPSNWAATLGTAALTALWGYVLSFRAWPLLAFVLFIVMPLPLALCKEEVELNSPAPPVES